MKSITFALSIYLYLLALFIYLYFTSGKSNAQEQLANHSKSLPKDSIINSLIHTLDTYYVLSEKGKEMGNVLKKHLKAGVYNSITDPSLLASRLEKDIKSVYDDKHLYIFYDPEFEHNQQASQTEQGKKEAKIQELEYEKTKNFMFTSAKILPRNIGYVQFNGFVDQVEQAEPTVTAAFAFLAHTDALIIDLRFNGGGSPAMVEQIESYFFKEKIHMSDIHERFTNKTISYYADPAKAKGISLAMPLYILTSKRTFSAAEDFSYSMQQIKRAQVIGDTTAGGAHPTRLIALKEGFVAHIPFARSINPYTKNNWEGSGVIPDIPVQSSKAFEKTLERIYLKQLAESQNDKQKRSIAWQINALKTSDETFIPVEILSSFCGEYQGGLKIFLRNGNLYCRNAERGNDIFRLIPLNEHLFTLDENVQVEFVEENKTVKLRMHFIDGNSRDKSRL